MNIYSVILIIHIIAGIVCFITGLIAMASRKKKGIHTTSGEIYHGAYVIILITSVIMAIMHWETSAYLFFIAIFSYSFAFIGYLTVKRKKKNWLGTHIIAMLGSYIGVVTAVLVVNAAKIPLLNQIPILLVWFLPTIIGSPLIFLVVNKYMKRGKTKRGTVVS